MADEKKDEKPPSRGERAKATLQGWVREVLDDWGRELDRAAEDAPPSRRAPGESAAAARARTDGADVGELLADLIDLPPDKPR